MSTTTFGQRLLSERNGLQENLGKLNLFIQSAKFKEIDGSQQVLLITQSGQMAGYLNTLRIRINLLELEKTGGA